MKSVWPETFVEEGNLTQTVFILRKALGDSEGQGLIVTIPRLGHWFAGEITAAAPNGTACCGPAHSGSPDWFSSIDGMAARGGWPHPSRSSRL